MGWALFWFWFQRPCTTHDSINRRFTYVINYHFVTIMDYFNIMIYVCLYTFAYETRTYPLGTLCGSDPPIEQSVLNKVQPIARNYIYLLASNAKSIYTLWAQDYPVPMTSSSNKQRVTSLNKKVWNEMADLPCNCYTTTFCAIWFNCFNVVSVFTLMLLYGIWLWYVSSG